MFDVYMNAHAIDPGARKRFATASMLAVVASVLAVGAYVGGQRMSIRRVDGPHVDLDVLFASIVATPPLAVEPPARPESSPEPTNDATPAIAPKDEPDAHEDVLEPAMKRVTGGRDAQGEGHGARTGVPGPTGPASGVPCPMPGSCRTPPIATRPINTDTTKPEAVVPESVVRARLRFSPDPSRAELLRTVAGQRGQGGTAVFHFCVDPDGRVSDVRVKRSAGDREVDRICRDALARWRFHPTKLGDVARRTCSEMSFVIAFE